MNEGKRFEEDFQNSFDTDDMFLYRLKDAGGWRKGGNTSFTPSNLCDFILYNGSELFLLELKSTKGKSIPFNNIKQLDSMDEISVNGVVPMFVLNFRSAEKTFLVPACDLKAYEDKTDRKSVPIKWCEDNYNILPQELKVTRYRYILDVFRPENKLFD